MLINAPSTETYLTATLLPIVLSLQNGFLLYDFTLPSQLRLSVELTTTTINLQLAYPIRRRPHSCSISLLSLPYLLFSSHRMTVTQGSALRFMQTFRSQDVS